MNWQRQEHRKGPRLRFSLRALLVVAATVCCVFAWLNSQTARAMRQKRIVEQIRQIGGNVIYAHQFQGKPLPMPPAFVRRFTGDIIMSDVARVTLRISKDEYTRILTKLPHLNELTLSSNRLSDAAMEPLSQFTELRRLTLRCSGVTDQSMPHLSNLHRLRRLELYSVQVTDDGLKCLDQLHQLEELNLRDTNVTPHGVEWLQRKLPRCEISVTAHQYGG